MEIKRLNQKGITLVELLAAIIIFSIISLLIWRFFFQTTTYSNEALTENQLQQEANIILNTIQQLHTTSKIESIKIVDGSLVIKSDKEGIIKFDRPGILYTGTSTYNSVPPVSFEFLLKLSAKNSVKSEYKTTFWKLSPN